MIGCSEGGTSIEDLAEKFPDKIVKIPVDVRQGLTDAQVSWVKRGFCLDLLRLLHHAVGGIIRCHVTGAIAADAGLVCIGDAATVQASWLCWLQRCSKSSRPPHSCPPSVFGIQAAEMVHGLAVTGDKDAAREQIKALYQTFTDCDCTMVEVRKQSPLLGHAS